MSFELIPLHGSAALIEVVRDVVDFDLIQRLSEAVERDSTSRTVRTKLIDLRGTRNELSVEEMRTIADHQLEHAEHQRATRTAILTDTPRNTALTIMFAGRVAEQREIEVFTTLAPAVAWLGLDANEVAAAWPAAAEELQD